MMPDKRIKEILLAMALWSLISSPTVAKEPRSYETSFEVAEALEGMEELAESAQLMLDLDRAQSSILSGACREFWTDLIDSGNELRMIRDRQARNEPLSPDEKTWERTQEVRRQKSEIEFPDCFAREAASVEVLRSRQITTNEALVDAYVWASSEYSFQLDTFTQSGNPTMERLQQAYPQKLDKNTETAAVQRSVDHWRQENSTLLADRDKIVAVVVSSGGGNEVFRHGSWKPIWKGFEFMVDDRLRTGSQPGTYLQFLDRAKGDNPMIIDIGPNTEIVLEDFTIALSDHPRRTGMIELVQGYVRVLTEGWLTSHNAILSVLAGTTVCGIRGTEIDILFNSELDQTIYKLYSGEVDIRTDIGTTVILRAGQTVTVTRGRVGPVRSLERARPSV